MSYDLVKEANEMKEKLIEIRRDLHQIPELGNTLPKTVAYVTSKLDEIGIEYEVFEDCSCILATIGKGDKCILLRGDMDGLPIVEASGLPFASTNGCAHCCGHDLHATMLLGAAMLLKKHESELTGTVKLFFQSGEETFTGAAAALEHGILENPKVDTAVGLHVGGFVKSGTVIYGGEVMTAVYGFEITLDGMGTHGSTPENGIDPINPAVQIYLALQSLIAREIPAGEEVTLTIGHLEAGRANNVIPAQAVLSGTLRTFKSELKDYVVQRISDIAESVAKTYRCKASIKVESDVPPTICNDEVTKACMDSIRSIYPDFDLLNKFHVMGSEDFAFFTEKVPATYFFMGAGLEDPKTWRGQHSPDIQFNEDVLPQGAAIHTKIAMDWLANHS